MQARTTALRNARDIDVLRFAVWRLLVPRDKSLPGGVAGADRGRRRSAHDSRITWGTFAANRRMSNGSWLPRLDRRTAPVGYSIAYGPQRSCSSVGPFPNCSLTGRPTRRRLPGRPPVRPIASGPFHVFRSSIYEPQFPSNYARRTSYDVGTRVIGANVAGCV